MITDCRKHSFCSQRLKQAKEKKKEKERRKTKLETSNGKIHKFLLVHFQVPAASWEMFLRKSGRI